MWVWWGHCVDSRLSNYAFAMSISAALVNGIGYNMHLVYCCSGEAAVIDVWGYFDDHKVIQLISLTMVKPL